MKKFICILTILILVLSCTACGKDSEPVTPDIDTGKNNTNGQTTDPVKDDKDTKPEYRGFVMENATGTKQTYIAIYPIDNVNSIFQFDVVSYNPGDDIPETRTYALHFVKQENGEYLSKETDQNGDVVTLTASYIEGDEFMVSGSDAQSPFTGIFKKTDERCEIGDVTILNFLRNVPAAGIGNFALYNPMDEIECYMASDWFICCNLFSETEFKYSFLIAKDFSVIINTTTTQGQVIYGSLEKTLNSTHTYEIYNDDGELISVEEPLVFPVVCNGTTMTVGSTDDIFLAAPYDLTKSLNIVSENVNIIAVDGTAITAVAPGNVTLKVTTDYCGTVKDFNLDIEVVEKDDSVIVDENEEFAVSEYVDSKYATYFDKVSMRATMGVCFEEGLISVDIIWADDAYTEHHWSYVGSDKADNGVYQLNGRYTIDNYTDDGFFSEKVVAENIAATLTKGTDGCFYWYDSNEETDHDCIFELPME